MIEEDKIINIKVNDLKRAACTNQRAKLFAKLVANLPNVMMASEDLYTTLLVQVLLSLSTNIIKGFYQLLGVNMGKFHYLKKRTLAAAIVRKWGERIWVMGNDAWV